MHPMPFLRSLLVLLLTLALSLQVMAAGGDAVCHHEHTSQSIMAEMDGDCGSQSAAAEEPCCDTDCQCTSHMVHSSVFLPEEAMLTVASKPVFQRFYALLGEVSQPHFPLYRPPRIA